MPKGYKLEYNQEEIENIRSLYEDDGLIIMDIADIYGVSYTGMLNTMKRAGIERRDAARKYTVNEHVFDIIDNEYAAYWYGFIYADGCVTRTRLQVGLAEKDRDQLIKLRIFMEGDNPILERDYESTRNSPSKMVVFSGVHLSQRLIELGIVPKRPNHQPMLDNVPDELMHHWIRGFFDGDGSATKCKRIIFCGREGLMLWLRDYMAERAGTNPNLSVFPCKHADIYYLSFSRTRPSKSVAEVMYSNATIWMARKRDVVNSWAEYNPSKRAKKGWVARKKNASG